MKISFCTTSMNRLCHLGQTVLKNIQHTSSHPDVEFVLLDYNSTDGLEDWAKENLSCHIDSGRVSFYRTSQPRYWVAAHAKNIAHKMATGDVLCNIDSDVLVPEGFAEYIEEAFSSGHELIMSFESEDVYGSNGCAGIIAAKRDHFYSVNGYDESISLGWGFDDMNYQFRCRMHNDLHLFTPPKICMCIPHPNEVRTENCQLKEIEATKELSFSICQDTAAAQDYVANKSHEWGAAVLTKNFTHSLRA